MSVRRTAMLSNAAQRTSRWWRRSTSRLTEIAGVFSALAGTPCASIAAMTARARRSALVLAAASVRATERTEALTRATFGRTNTRPCPSTDSVAGVADVEVVGVVAAWAAPEVPSSPSVTTASAGAIRRARVGWAERAARQERSLMQALLRERRIRHISTRARVAGG